MSWVALSGASCDKKTSAKPEKTSDTSVVDAADRAKDKHRTEPIYGVSLEGISAENKQRFHKFANSLVSPCGKGKSLRTAAKKASSCIKGRFAARYLAQMLRDEADDDVVQRVYKKLYETKQPIVKLELDAKAPHTGPTDAKVKLVEFFDYGCAHCKEFHPTVSELAQEFPQDLIIYYKNFVLGHFKNSKLAAQSALAAHKQGKFKQMHNKLWEMQGAHTPKALDGYAKDIGLDMAQFKKDQKAAAVLVDTDRQQGDRANVQGTPTLLINGRSYEGFKETRYLKIWINQELVLNR